MYKAVWKIVHTKNVRTNGENMKKLLLVISVLVLFSLPLYAQTQGVHKEDRPHVSGDDGVAVLFRRCDAVVSPSAGTDGDYTIPCVDSNGNLRISGAVTIDTTGLATSALQGGGLPAALGTGGGLKVDGSGTALPVSGTFWQATQPVSVAALPTDAPIDSAATSNPVQAGGIYQTTPTVIEDGDVAAFHFDVNQNLKTVNADVTTLAGMAGSSTCYLSSAASTNATNCKASAGSVISLHGTNTTATAGYLRMYNLAAAPTCSSGTGFIETIPLAPADVFFGVNGRTITLGQAYSTGIGFCLTGGGSSTDDTAVGTGIYITILYK
jgi:hypothetical protein